MKKIFTSLLMLAALLCSTTAWAQYVKIGGTNYSSTGNITNSAITSGTVHFNASTNTLTLKNATISYAGDGILASGFTDGLTITCEGSNTITCSGTSNLMAGIYGKSKIWIGSASGQVASLTVKNTGAGNAIRMEGTYRLDISGLHFTAESSNNDCLHGLNNDNIFAPNYTWMTLKAPSGKAAMSGFTAIYTTLHDVQQSFVKTPGCSFNSSKGGIVDANGNLVNEAKVYPALVIGSMPIVVGNDQSFTTSSTGASLMGLTAGTLKWDHSSKTLTMNGVTLSKGIISFLSSMKINSTGSENTVKGSGIALDIYGSTEITGDKKITFENTSGTAIWMNNRFNCPLTVNVNATVKVTGASRGVFNEYNSSAPNSDLILKKAGNNSDYFFYGGSEAAVKGVCHLTLTDMDFFYNSSYGVPGCYWDESSRTIKKTGGEVVKDSEVDIYAVKETYPVYVAGKQLNNCNCLAVGSPYITAGTVTYGSSSNTLTLNGVTMDVTDASPNAIKTTSSAGNVTIKAVGTSHLTAKNNALDLSSNTTFNSESVGMLYLESTNYAGITTRGAVNVKVDMSNGFLGTTGATYGYYGDKSNNDALTLKKATSDNLGYRFEGSEAALFNVGSLTLDNMDFWHNTTSGCYFGNNSIRKNGGNLATGKVEFGSIKEQLPIYIAGKQLNRVNGETTTICVGSPYIKSGTQSVTYKPSDKILTLNNAEIENTSSDNTIVADADVTIQVKGSNKLLSSTAFAALRTNNKANITLDGDGSLTGTSTGYPVYLYLGGGLTVKGDVTLDVSGGSGGIGDNNAISTQRLTVSENAVVKAKTIQCLNSLTLTDGQAIVEPSGATFQNNAVRDDGNIAQNVVIMKVENYGLAVCDEAVNSYNCDDIRGDGKFKYDPDSKTLTISGANINNTEIKNVVENNNVDGLKVKFDGDNSFKVKSNIFIVCKSTSITGTGTVTGELADDDGYGIWYKADADITLDGATFSFKGEKGISGYSSATVNVTINSGKFIFEPKGTSGTAIEVTSLTLGEGMFITEPDGGQFSSSLKAITIYGSTVYQGKVVIEGATAYDLTIGGKAVNSVNCKDVLGNGVFKYDASSNTLTIKGNYTYTGSANIVESSIPDLTINVAGNSTFVSGAANAMFYLHKNTTVTGGKLTLTCTESGNRGIGFYLYGGGTLTFKDAEVNITGDGFWYGITGEDDSDYHLVIDNSDITVSAHQYGAIYDWGDITLTDCYVEEPRPSIIDPRGIQDGEGNYIGSGDETATVVIKHGEDAVRDIETAASNVTDVYDVSGRRLDQTRRGINIVRTSDGKAHKILKK